jgi:hypothetical protein
MINTYLNQTVTIRKKLGQDEYNEVVDSTYYTDITVKARFEFGDKITRDTNGQEIIADATLFTTTELNVDDIVIYDGKEFPVVKVFEHPQLNGINLFYESLLGFNRR